MAGDPGPVGQTGPVGEQARHFMSCQSIIPFVLIIAGTSGT